MGPLVRLVLPVDLDQKEIEAQLVCQVKWDLLECLVDTDWMVCPVKRGTLALNLRMKCKWIAHERLPLRQQTLHLVHLVPQDPQENQEKRDQKAKWARCHYLTPKLIFR
jgi:hypothetical protein